MEVLNASKSPRRSKRLKEVNRVEQIAAQFGDNATLTAPKPSQVTPKDSNTPLVARLRDNDSDSTTMIRSPSSGTMEEERASVSNDFDTLLGTSVTVPTGDQPNDDDVFGLDESDSAKPDKRSC